MMSRIAHQPQRRRLWLVLTAAVLALLVLLVACNWNLVRALGARSLFEVDRIELKVGERTTLYIGSGNPSVGWTTRMTHEPDPQLVTLERFTIDMKPLSSVPGDGYEKAYLDITALSPGETSLTLVDGDYLMECDQRSCTSTSGHTFQGHTVQIVVTN